MEQLVVGVEDRQPIDIIDTSPFKFFVEKTCTRGDMS
jgi:hypothetical protein